METLEINAGIQIQKAPYEVFESIVNPDKMCNYFISESTGSMEEGKELTWRFPEFDMDVPVRVGKIEHNKQVSYYWEGAKDHETLVEISLEPYSDDSTIVHVTEKPMPHDTAGIKWLAGNTEGWANFLACLKAYLEYGINLRQGGFIYRAQKK